MKDTEAKDFVRTMRDLNPAILDDDNEYVEAICFALKQVPKVKSGTWFGQIEHGVFYTDSEEARWFPNTNEKEVAILLSKELL